MTREEAISLLVNATYSDEWQGNEDLATANLMAIRSIEAWDEVINHLESTAQELLDRENEKQSHAFAKGITFAVSMIKNHMKEVEE